MGIIITRPNKVIQCFRLSEVRNSFAAMEEALDKGFYLAGFVSYEAGFAFEKLSHVPAEYDFPLLWFGVFERKEDFFKESDFSPEEYQIANLSFDLSEDRYIASIAKIKERIAAGDTYQVNYTGKYEFSFSGSPRGLYHDLKKKQPTPYSAFIETGDLTILSLSPELFFEKTGDKITVRPMKGTMKRGRNLREDIENAELLKNDHKNRAENLMIVDLLRNDLGRISNIGSVKVNSLFDVERHKTLFQMTSNISSELKEGLRFYDLFKALFPSGSVTGAPKIRTMEIIRDLEKGPRGIYCGAIGFFEPNRNAVFNVAIRTVVLRDGKGEMGIGSGIVWDSEPEAEFSECKLKGEFLVKEVSGFQLIETMRWDRKKGIELLGLHLARLKNSAEYFGFSYDEEEIRKALQIGRGRFQTVPYRRDQRIRLLLAENGEIEVSSSELEADDPAPKPITISSEVISSADPFFFHKTTRREMYEREYAKYKAQGFYEAIFKNERGEITEGSRTNIFIKKDGVYYTPPVECGLLPGVFRKHFMRQNKVVEKLLFEKDLIVADEIYVGNAVRDLVKVSLPPKKEAIPG